jgi:hypothetical protein
MYRRIYGYRKLAAIALALVACFAVPAAASAHPHYAAGSALLHADGLAYPPPTTCPVGVPTQPITVVNQANVRPQALAKVENAVVAQSMQLRDAWQTPCVQFGPGGWVLTLTPNGIQHDSDGSTSFTTSGRHCGPLGQSRFTCYSAQTSITVNTATLSYTVWARAFSHEVDEALVDPTDAVWALPGMLEEVCDPVENWTYPLDEVQVSDFVLPSYFTQAVGPWDEMGVLTSALRS